MTTLSNLKVKIFADGADLDGIKAMCANSLIKGFTTNPTLMRKAGVKDYEDFAKSVLDVVTDLPVSFEVFADEPEQIEQQALEIASWGANVNVKIPVTNTKGVFLGESIKRLSAAGVILNVTALMTLEQVENVTECLDSNTNAIVSVFAGRIADTGRDPVPLMSESVKILSRKPKAELIWASPRELYNVVQADLLGCHIITATNNILKKLPTLGKDLDQFSLETVKMFYNDATEAGYNL